VWLRVQYSFQVMEAHSLAAGAETGPLSPMDIISPNVNYISEKRSLERTISAVLNISM